MIQSMQPILQHLFQANDLDDVSMERLDAFVAEYPSFGIGHYLLSRKLRTEDADRYNGETQRTNLYFTNPFWLQWMLENSGTNHIQPADAPTVVERQMFPSEPFDAAEEPDLMPEEPDLTAEEPDLAPEEPIRDEEPPFVLEEVATQGEYAEEVGKKEADLEEVNYKEDAEVADAEVVDTKKEDAKLAEAREEVVAGVTEEENTEEMSTVAERPALTETEEATHNDQGPSAAERLLQSVREAHGLRQSLQRINEDLNSDKEALAAETQWEEKAAEEEKAAPEENTAREDKQAQERASEEGHVPVDYPASEEGHAPEDYPAPEAEETRENEPAFSSGAIGAAVERAALAAGRGEQEQKPTPTQDGGVAAHAIALAEQSIPPTEQPLNSEEQPIVFEPYHTIDYFASQGIKLSLDENPSDSLGKQLKSFTDWLKVMRRLPQKDREIVPDIAAERNIQSIAAHSIEGKEVVTETMAEVLAKQGMPEKAREVYTKLSLQNPGKRAYFAAKIEQLNIH